MPTTLTLPAFTAESVASCAGLGDDFHNYQSGDIPRLRRICRACPLADACREWAIDHGETGYWGGTTEDERRHIRIQRREPGQRRYGTSTAEQRRQIVAAHPTMPTAQLAAMLGVQAQRITRDRADLRRRAA